MCTRLLKNVSFHHRWFASKFFDREHPYEVILKLRRQTPKSESDVDVAFIPGKGLAPILTSKTSFAKSTSYRYKSKEAVEKAIKDLNNGDLCLKCGHPSKCTKSMFKKWE